MARDRRARWPRRGTSSWRLLGVVALAAVVVLAGCTGLDGPTSGATTTPTGGEPASPDGAEQFGKASGPDPTPAPLPAGRPLDGTRSLDDGAVTIRGIGPNRLGYGAAVGDVNEDGTPDLVVGAPRHNTSNPAAGAAFVYFGPVEPGNLSIEDADVRLPGEGPGDWAGTSVAVADVSADGVGDIVVGAPRSDRGGDDAGAVYVLYGGRHLGGQRPLATADVVLAGAAPRSFAGASVDGADLVGGREADLVVGAPGAGDPGRRQGAVYLVDGRNAELLGSLADADTTYVGARAGDRAGRAVAVAGDVDGDGNPDLVIGASRARGAAQRSGVAYVVNPRGAPGRSSLAEAAVTLQGVDANDSAGFDVGGAGDVNGDGTVDLAVGAPGDDDGGPDAGTVYVVYGSPELSGTVPLSAADASFAGTPGDRVGYAVGMAGDVTCDGADDLLVGAPGNDTGGDDAGAVSLVAGGRTGELAPAATFVGATAGEQVGRADALVAIAGNGTTGLVVSAPFGPAPSSAHVLYASC